MAMIAMMEIDRNIVMILSVVRNRLEFVSSSQFIKEKNMNTATVTSIVPHFFTNAMILS